MKKADFAVKILKQYSKESYNPMRSTSDLSPLEEWLIVQLYNLKTKIRQQTTKTAEIKGK